VKKLNTTKAEENVSTDVIKDFIGEFVSLNEKAQILVVGVIKGISLASNIETQKKGA
jgi:hypothetical protein